MVWCECQAPIERHKYKHFNRDIGFWQLSYQFCQFFFGFWAFSPDFESFGWILRIVWIFRIVFGFWKLCVDFDSFVVWIFRIWCGFSEFCVHFEFSEDFDSFVVGFLEFCVNAIGDTDTWKYMIHSYHDIFATPFDLFHFNSTWQPTGYVNLCRRSAYPIFLKQTLIPQQNIKNFVKLNSMCIKRGFNVYPRKCWLRRTIIFICTQARNS